MKSDIAILFPGQGSFYRSALKECRAAYPQVDAVLAEIDEVAKPWLNASVATTLFDATAPDIADLLAHSPELLQMAIYGISVATYKILQSYGLRPAVLAGHSFGEIAALTCGGAFTVGQGAEIVLHRMAALRVVTKGAGYMAALGTDRLQAEKILDLAGASHSAVAVVNHKTQTVISGAAAEMDTCAEIAKALKIPVVKLNSPYPFHSPVVAAAREDFARRIRQIPEGKLEARVFSPILNRYYTDGDAFADCLAEHLVKPVNFASAVERLYEEGVRLFAECGAMNTLGSIAGKALGKPDVTTIACLDHASGEMASLKAAIRSLTIQGALPEAQPARPGALLLPEVSPAAFDSFWAARGSEVVTFARRQFQDFEKSQRPRAAEAPPAQAATVPPATAPETVKPAAVPAPAAQAVRPALTRSALFSELAGIYAAALEYPQEVFTEEVELEGELGIDSVKQTELLARTGEEYHLPPRSPDFRLGDYNTMGKIVDFVYAALQNGASGPKVNGAPNLIPSGAPYESGAYVN